MDPREPNITSWVSQLKGGKISKSQLFEKLSRVSSTELSLSDTLQSSHDKSQEHKEARRPARSSSMLPISPVHRPYLRSSSSATDFLINNKNTAQEKVWNNRLYGHTSPQKSTRDWSKPRREQAEEKIRKAMEEDLTFTPQIRSLPEEYASTRNNNIPFHARVDAWKERKVQFTTRRKKELDSVEMEECTFAPNINPNSQAAAQRRRPSSASTSISERLYRDADQYEKRDILALQETERREAAEERECTFKPHLIKSSHDVVPRYRTSKTYEPSENEECTFVPCVNAIPSSMTQAHQYVQTPIFDRLSLTPTAAETVPQVELNFDVDIYDIDNFEHSSSLRKIRPNSAPIKDVREKPIDKRREKKFLDFLQRQEHRERAKERKLLEVKNNSAYKHRPQISTKSTKLMQGRDSFLERLKKNEIKRQEYDATMRTDTSKNADCTFTPKINKKSAALESRSVADLCHGDLLHRQATHASLKLQMDQEEIADLSFRPQLNKYLPPTGKLKILTEPETYIQRMHDSENDYSERKRRALEDTEREEIAACTFQPKIHGAPSYVTRIAASMALTKASRKDGRSEPKPSWK